jgi:translation initiation factor IF-1
MTLDSEAAEVPFSKSRIMNQESRMAIEGIIRAQLPSGLYEVEIEGARRVTAHAGSGTDRNFIRLLVGDRVLVELAQRDATRGRVVKKV